MGEGRSRILARRVRWSLAALLASTVALAGCGSGGEAPSDRTEQEAGVPFGATKEEYIAAFKRVEPIKLVLQTGGTKGALPNQGREAYMAAVEEWSGGVITFDVAYSNGLVTDAAEVDDALGDGRLDMVFSLIASYEPDIYPINNILSEASYLSGSGMVGTLANFGWTTELVYSKKEFAKEWEDAGIHMLLPTEPVLSGITTALACAELAPTSMTEAKGRLVAVSGMGKTKQVEALGMSPVSMPWNEQYEGLERGVINCAATSLSAMIAGGLFPVAPHATIDTKVALSAPNAALAFSAERWNSLPLVAKQLLFDRLDVLIQSNVNKGAEGAAQAIAEMKKNGGKVVQFDEEARKAILDASDAWLRESLGSAKGVVGEEEIRKLSQDWIAESEKASGISATQPIDEFLAGFQPDSLDLKKYTDLLFERVLLKARPGGS